MENAPAELQTNKMQLHMVRKQKNHDFSEAREENRIYAERQKIQLLKKFIKDNFPLVSP